MIKVELGPIEKRPRVGCWRQFTHPIVNRHPASVVSVWVNGCLRVSSAIEEADYPDGQGTGPQWHLSVSVAGMQRRARKHEVKQLLRDFDMEGAEEDNHHPGVARHFWIPLDPAHRVECQCKAEEATLVEPDGYAWTNPKSATMKDCRGCEFFHMTGRRCPIHHQGGVMETEQKQTAAELIVELRELLDGEAESKVVDGDRRDQILQQLAEALQHVPACALKMKPGEPGFTLRAQDLSADALVFLWSDVQRFLAKQVECGVPLSMAFLTVRERLQKVFRPEELAEITEKGIGAYQIAARMQEWTTRKLAD